MYADRVHVKGCLVFRKYPIVNGWTYGALKERQEIEIMYGGFGGRQKAKKRPTKNKHLQTYIENEAEEAVYDEVNNHYKPM